MESRVTTVIVAPVDLAQERMSESANKPVNYGWVPGMRVRRMRGHMVYPLTTRILPNCQRIYISFSMTHGGNPPGSEKLA